ncbi:hypothetical protein HID58_033210 [Brassica napus]|uniref:Uncharacterized protein n=1 Tax=Brassica napus TaxID=3708 RepID=A0ABQ8BYL8_BRANA|nr:hypothetical protein HID58_033210 [Brassica napus]
MHREDNEVHYDL